VNELEIPEIGYIRTDMLPQISMVFSGKVLPPVRIYGNEELVVFVSDLAFPDSNTFHMADKLGSFMKEHDVSMSISLAGIGSNSPSGTIYGVGTSDEMLQTLKDNEIEMLPMGSISGGSGALLLECYRQSIPSIALLAETYGNRPDPRSASGLLDVIGRILNKEINTESLIKEAEQLEATLAELSKDVEKQTKSEDYSSMYI
jgi:uncharacterized protein